MRGLSAAALQDLKDGLLAPLLQRVRADHTLCLELRDNHIIVYYRGGKLYEVVPRRQGYFASFDAHYLLPSDTPGSNTSQLGAPADIADWITTFAIRKQAMDLYFGAHPREEREVQQLLVRDNNMSGSARATDVYVCDIEYATKGARFDFIGVSWPSSSMERRKATGRRLILGEIKYGDGALIGSSGLHGHLKGINQYLEDTAEVGRLKEEMVSVFNQKRDLELIDCEKDLKSFSDDAPLLLLVLVNHDPDKTRLGQLLRDLPPCPRAEVRFASASLFGFGLFDPALLSRDEADQRLKEWHGQKADVTSLDSH